MFQTVFSWNVDASEMRTCENRMVITSVFLSLAFSPWILPISCKKHDAASKNGDKDSHQRVYKLEETNMGELTRGIDREHFLHFKCIV